MGVRTGRHPELLRSGEFALAAYQDTDPRVVAYLRLTGEMVSLGREDAKEGVFPDIDLKPLESLGVSARHVSRLHCTLLQGPTGTVTLVAGPKTSGTQVNRTQVEDGTQHPLVVGDRLVLGGHVRLKLVHV